MVLIVGYQTDNTLGKKLGFREPVVNIFGEPHPLRKEVAALDSFSCHADRNVLLPYIGGFLPDPLRGILLAYGVTDHSEKLGTACGSMGSLMSSCPPAAIVW
jgi:metallo-beta-lactamase family protein